MKKILLLFSLSILIAGSILYAALVPNTVNPVIKKFGPVFEVPFATEWPDSTLEYKIIVDAGEKNETPAELYLPLQHVARTYNLHVYAGVPQNKLKVVVAIWGEPIPVVLNNEAYKKKYGVDNPNIKIISELKKAGVTVIGCGQSIQKFGLDEKDINPDVTVALSRITVVSSLQMKGYAYFKY